VRRRRECLKCGNRYTTYERLERPNLAVVKRDKRRELFDRDKLKRAVYQSVGKFLNGEIEVEEIVSRVEDTMYSTGELEITSQQIGDAVMAELAGRNEVAYIRFASVYREFKNADEFVETLRELRKKPDSTCNVSTEEGK
jgi:transcriptional repressor NrdR